MKEEKNIISNWLTQLQRESWNLELLISGFSIFLLMNAGDAILNGAKTISLNLEPNTFLYVIANILLMVLYLATIVLTINLLIHIFLRGFWIGTIGLRSVQEKTDFKKLNYTDFFTEKLQKNVISLDHLLIKLDTVCSVIFAFTFLIIFMFFSFFISMSIMAIIIYLVQESAHLLPSNDYLDSVYNFSGILFLIFIVSGLFYAVDTLSLGFLKKQKWLQKIYYPIYFVWSKLTFSGIYQGIYYHLASRFSKWKVMLLLCSYVFMFILFPLHKLERYPFYPDNDTNKKLYNNRYDDLRADDIVIKTASIPSLIIHQKHLPLFIRYKINHNKTISTLCTDYEPSKSVGIISGIKISSEGFSINNPNVDEKNPELLLNCLTRIYTIYLNDSIVVNPDFAYYMHPKMKEKGIHTMLSTENLPKGKNHIKITRKKINKEEEVEEIDYSLIPFWLE